MSAAVTFDEFLQSLTDLADGPPPQDGSTEPTVREETEAFGLSLLREQVERTVEQLRALDAIAREDLTRLVWENPVAVPILASCVGLGQEQLKNQLRHRLGSSGWVTLARTNAKGLIDVLDEQYDLVKRLTEQLERPWTFGDVLVERHQWSRKTATRAIGRGRRLEDEVEAIVLGLGLSCRMRTQFVGRGGKAIPCDLAIPKDGAPLIVGGAKGFNSTGSKLSDAVREIVEMAEYRLPTQFVFAFIDGIGWKSRQADLRRIFELWDRRSIDGLYTLAHLNRFREDLQTASYRLGLLQK